jgi:hypothetical protein
VALRALVGRLADVVVVRAARLNVNFDTSLVGEMPQDSFRRG